MIDWRGVGAHHYESVRTPHPPEVGGWIFTPDEQFRHVRERKSSLAHAEAGSTLYALLRGLAR